MHTAFSKILCGDSRDLRQIPDGSVDLIVTSPPYPMIQMWDDCFAAQSPEAAAALRDGRYDDAFEAMHAVLDAVWNECLRVLRPSGFLCINIGDATRTCGGTFRLFSNHTRILRHFMDKGCRVLPDILWRKASNAPNKFMGSGMYPAGAYVTYEHEYILILCKGGKRIFRKGEDTARRRASAYFWEERNVWFSDLWDIRGTGQALFGGPRDRSAAFPVEIPYRLVHMYSAYGDTVLDPFGGLGTTAVACAAAMRNCILCERDPALRDLIVSRVAQCREEAAGRVEKRLLDHQAFLAAMEEDDRERCYKNQVHHFLVKTRQETELALYRPCAAEDTAPGEIQFSYSPFFSTSTRNPPEASTQ